MQATTGKFWLAGFVPGLAANAPAATWSNIAAYRVPTANSDAAAITAGPDGALWFTEFDANKIGRITTAGVITEYAAAERPRPAGPDGALWFTEYDGNTIGRITTGGVITAYHLSTPNGDPNGITAGPDALWFTDSGGNKIGRISIHGVITAYSVPTPNSLPSGITVGPDGALWFTEALGNNIARAPACGLGLSASFTDGTLTMNFNPGASTPATWYANLNTSTGGGTQLWSKPIPVVVPPASFTRTLGPGFPNLGEVGIISGLQTAPGEGLCYETVNVNTAQ